jgi:hypothetical protein
MTLCKMTFSSQGKSFHINCIKTRILALKVKGSLLLEWKYILRVTNKFRTVEQESQEHKNTDDTLVQSHLTVKCSTTA